MCKIITTETAFYAFVGLLHEPDTNKSSEAQGQRIKKHMGSKPLNFF